MRAIRAPVVVGVSVERHQDERVQLHLLIHRLEHLLEVRQYAWHGVGVIQLFAYRVVETVLHDLVYQSLIVSLGQHFQTEFLQHYLVGIHYYRLDVQRFTANFFQ